MLPDLCKSKFNSLLDLCKSKLNSLPDLCESKFNSLPDLITSLIHPPSPTVDWMGVPPPPLWLDGVNPSPPNLAGWKFEFSEFEFSDVCFNLPSHLLFPRFVSISHRVLRSRPPPPSPRENNIFRLEYKNFQKVVKQPRFHQYESPK